MKKETYYCDLCKGEYLQIELGYTKIELTVYQQSKEITKEETTVSDNDPNKCRSCKNCFDNDETLHFNRCRLLCLCVDCTPNACNGDEYDER